MAMAVWMPLGMDVVAKFCLFDSTFVMKNSFPFVNVCSHPITVEPLLLSQPLSCHVFCPDGPICMDGESPLLLSQPLSCRNKTLNAQGDSKRGSTVVLYEADVATE